MTRPNTRDAFGESFGTRLATPLNKPLSESEMHSMLQLEEMRRNLSSGKFVTNIFFVFLKHFDIPSYYSKNLSFYS